VDFDWKSLVRTIAPAIASAFGTPLAGLATKAIVDIFLGGDEKDVDEATLAAAVQNATPDQLIALKQADLQFQKDLAALEVDLERIAASDRDSARKRESTTGDVWTPRALALGVTIGFFGILCWLIAAGTPDAGGDALLVMLGSLGTAWAGMMTYYFGSTAGSARKTTLLARANPIDDA
jgi:hypothetical protein